MFGHISGCHNWEGDVLLASRGWQLGKPLSILQCTGRRPPHTGCHRLSSKGPLPSLLHTFPVSCYLFPAPLTTICYVWSLEGTALWHWVWPGALGDLDSGRAGVGDEPQEGPASCP